MDSISSSPRRPRFRTLCNVIVGVLCAAFAALPITGLCLLWSYCVAQVPVAHAWAGFIKIGITLAIALVGGGATIALTFLFGIAALAVAVVILE